MRAAHDTLSNEKENKILEKNKKKHILFLHTHHFSIKSPKPSSSSKFPFPKLPVIEVHVQNIFLN